MNLKKYMQQQQAAAPAAPAQPQTPRYTRPAQNPGQQGSAAPAQPPYGQKAQAQAQPGLVDAYPPEINNPEANMNQIVRIDGRNCFVEVVKKAMSLKAKNSEGKIQLNFVRYDGQTKKQTGFGSFYFSFKEWFVLDDYIRKGEFVDDYVAAKTEQARTGESYASPVKQYYKGTVSQGQVISRALQLIPGNKDNTIVLALAQGPGEQTREGLIKPAGKPAQTISVPMALDDMIGMIKLVDQEIQAHKTGEEVYRVLDERFARLEQMIDQVSRKMD